MDANLNLNTLLVKKVLVHFLDKDNHLVKIFRKNLIFLGVVNTSGYRVEIIQKILEFVLQVQPFLLHLLIEIVLDENISILFFFRFIKKPKKKKNNPLLPGYLILGI